MKPLFHTAVLIVFAAVCSTSGQGTYTYVYDQQSAPRDTGNSEYWSVAIPYPGGVVYREGGLVQSFTPLLPSIDFVRLRLVEMSAHPASIWLNLRASPGGPVLATSSIATTNKYDGTFEFIFSYRVAITPGNTYYFDTAAPIRGVEAFTQNVHNIPYAGGHYSYGSETAVRSIWFREGMIVVPEPGSGTVLLLGAGMFLLSRRIRGKRGV